MYSGELSFVIQFMMILQSSHGNQASGSLAQNECKGSSLNWLFGELWKGQRSPALEDWKGPSHIQASIHPTCLLGSYYVQGIVLSTRDTEESKKWTSKAELRVWENQVLTK